MTSGAAASASRVDHPLFARIWPVVAAHEAEAIRALRRENLAGLSGRVLEVGAGVGTNFAYYPVAVEQVIAMEPEPRLAAKARIAAADAPVPIVVTDKTVEEFRDTETFDAVVCSLVLCSVSDPGAALGAGCSGSSTRHFGPGWRATVTRIAIPNARSSTPDSWWTAPGGSGHFPPGCRYRCQSWLWAARTGPSYS